jgi:hypothetical protein
MSEKHGRVKLLISWKSGSREREEEQGTRCSFKSMPLRDLLLPLRSQLGSRSFCHLPIIPSNYSVTTD